MRSLEELAWRERVKREVERVNRLLKQVRPSPEGFAAGSVREDRDEGH